MNYLLYGLESPRLFFREMKAYDYVAWLEYFRTQKLLSIGTMKGKSRNLPAKIVTILNSQKLIGTRWHECSAGK